MVYTLKVVNLKLIIKGNFIVKTIQRIALLGFVVAAISVLASCGTVHGVGQDVATAGHDIERAAR